jgi:hypothetical protein
MPHGTTHELSPSRRVPLGGKLDSAGLMVARKDGATRHERTLESAPLQLCNPTGLVFHRTSDGGRLTGNPSLEPP